MIQMRSQFKVTSILFNTFALLIFITEICTSSYTHRSITCETIKTSSPVDLMTYVYTQPLDQFKHELHLKDQLVFIFMDFRNRQLMEHFKVKIHYNQDQEESLFDNQSPSSEIDIRSTHIFERQNLFLVNFEGLTENNQKGIKNILKKKETCISLVSNDVSNVIYNRMEEDAFVDKIAITPLILENFKSESALIPKEIEDSRYFTHKGSYSFSFKQKTQLAPLFDNEILFDLEYKIKLKERSCQAFDVKVSRINIGYLMNKQWERLPTLKRPSENLNIYNLYDDLQQLNENRKGFKEYKMKSINKEDLNTKLKTLYRKRKIKEMNKYNDISKKNKLKSESKRKLKEQIKVSEFSDKYLTANSVVINSLCDDDEVGHLGLNIKSINSSNSKNGLIRENSIENNLNTGGLYIMDNSNGSGDMFMKSKIELWTENIDLTYNEERND